MKDAQRLKLYFEKDNILELLFALFLGAFFFIESTKGHRVFFVTLVVIPFIIFHRTQLFNEKKSLTILLSSVLLSLFLFGIFWSSAEPDAQIYKTIVKVLSTYLFIQISFYYFSQKNLNLLQYVFIACAVIASLVSIFQFYQQHPFPQSRLQNTLHDLHPVITANFFALAFLVTTFQIVQNKNKKYQLVIFIFAALTLVSAVLLTHSRGAILGLIICGVSILAIKKLRYLVIFLILIGLLGFAYWLFEPSLFESLFQRGSSNRFTIYKILIERVSDTRLFGLGTIADETIDFNTYYTFQHAHSIFLASYYHIGIVGLMVHGLIAFYAVYQSFIIYSRTGQWLPFCIIIFGLFCLNVDGSFVIKPYLMEWLLFWVPVTFSAAQYNILIVKNNKHKT
jgi:O-antigen ligase